MSRLSIPTTARLPSSLRVDPSNLVVIKSLNRLSRESLIALTLDWLDDGTIANAMPYLDRRGPDEEPDADDLYPPCKTVAELQQLYADMQEQRGSKRDVVSRVLEGDWRHGLTLYQLAMIDFAYLDEHPASQKWTAYKILPLAQPSHDGTDADDESLRVDETSLQVPRFHPSTFLQNLQDQVLPDVKAHYHFYRPSDYPVLMLRIFAIDSPYNSQLALSSLNNSGNNGGGGTSATNYTSSRTVYLAFPDGAPSLYISKSQSAGASAHGESRSLQGLIVKGVPKALSRPRQRFTLRNTGLTSRNLDALLDRKGPGRTNAAGGGWSVYAASDEQRRRSPLDPVLPSPPLSREASHSEHSRKRTSPLTQQRREAKRARLVARARFGHSALITDGKGVERFDVVLRDPYPVIDGIDVHNSDLDDVEAPAPLRRGPRRRLDTLLEEDDDAADDDDADGGGGGDGNANGAGWTPSVRVTFQGTHVFAGIRQLVEAGIVDGEKMPGWMTGEDGVTAGIVRHGRIRGNKGSDL